MQAFSRLSRAYLGDTTHKTHSTHVSNLNMGPDHETGRHFLPILTAGFVLLVLLLVISGWVAIDSMRFIESRCVALRHRATGHRTADRRAAERRGKSQQRLLLAGVAPQCGSRRDAEASGRGGIRDPANHRQRVGIGRQVSVEQSPRAAELFIDEGRTTIRSAKPPSEEFYERHQNLLAALSDLAGRASPRADRSWPSGSDCRHVSNTLWCCSASR